MLHEQGREHTTHNATSAHEADTLEETVRLKEIEMVERLRERESEREMSKKHHTTPENTENKVTAEGDDAPK